MERANLKWTILLMLVVAFGLASATMARDLVTEGRSGVREEGEATHFHYRILPKGTPVPPSGPSCRPNCSPPYHTLPKGAPIPPSAPSPIHK
ncbi:hypothetical protein NL676_036283 [Syzygium grande]|nr:hypothetical protein NL676_036283 [Syzygium grande]